MLLRAILILLQRLPGCSRVVLVPAFVPSMFSMSRQQGKIRSMMQHRPNIEIFAKSLFSTPSIAQRTPLVCSIKTEERVSKKTSRFQALQLKILFETTNEFFETRHISFASFTPVMK